MVTTLKSEEKLEISLSHLGSHHVQRISLFFCERDTIFPWKVYKRALFSGKNGIQKGKRSDLGSEPPRVNFVLVFPPGVGTWGWGI